MDAVSRLSVPTLMTGDPVLPLTTLAATPTPPAGMNSACQVPVVALNEASFGIPATSTARVTAAAVVGIHDVGNAPASSCAFCTVPVTVRVSDPAVGVKVSETRR